MNVLSRILAYHRKHGTLEMITRARTQLARVIKHRRTHVLYYDLDPTHPPAESELKVNRIRSEDQLPTSMRGKMANYWNPEIYNRFITERFARGAELWLGTIEGNFVGFGWTMKGNTIEPHYLPFGQNDIHFFDFLIFPEHRGKSANPKLVAAMLRELSEKQKGRCYIEVAEWNKPQIKSLKKTPFIPLCTALIKTRSNTTHLNWSPCSNQS